jgi:hypothetical protein
LGPHLHASQLPLPQDQNRNIWIDTLKTTLYVVHRLLVAFLMGTPKREPGANPGLPRSGKQDRTPSYHWFSLKPGRWVSRNAGHSAMPASPKTCQ